MKSKLLFKFYFQALARRMETEGESTFVGWFQLSTLYFREKRKRKKGLKWIEIFVLFLINLNFFMVKIALKAIVLNIISLLKHNAKIKHYIVLNGLRSTKPFSTEVS